MLLIYVEAMAIASFTTLSCTLSPPCFSRDSRILKYFDFSTSAYDEVLESNSISGDARSSKSHPSSSNFGLMSPQSFNCKSASLRWSSYLFRCCSQYSTFDSAK
jgi:hypothetical protein